jgi:hypothetical protein
MSNDGVQIRYLVSVAFAVLVFGAMFYALVIYEFALPELIQGAFISMGTLAVQYVFGEQVASGAARRAERSFATGQHTPMPGATITAPNAETVTVVDSSGTSTDAAGTTETTGTSTTTTTQG